MPQKHKQRLSFRALVHANEHLLSSRARLEEAIAGIDLAQSIVFKAIQAEMGRRRNSEARKKEDK